jgi:colanic acid/amylovoran biosynthesis protein
VYAREDISLKVLENELGLANVKIGPDLGYVMPTSQRKQDSARFGVERVAITVRPYRFPKMKNPDLLYANYIDSVADYIKYLIEIRGASVDFIVQVKGPSAHENDSLAIEEVLSRLPTSLQDVISVRGEDGNAEDLIDLYAGYDYILGTRFHSVIFGHIGGVKSLCVAYGGNKTRGIMRMVGLEEYVLDIWDIDGPRLIKATEKLVNDDMYISKLNMKLNQFHSMHDQMILDVQTIIGSRP